MARKRLRQPIDTSDINQGDIGRLIAKQNRAKRRKILAVKRGRNNLIDDVSLLQMEAEFRRLYAKQRRSDRMEIRHMKQIPNINSGETNIIQERLNQRHVIRALDRHPNEVSSYGAPEFKCKYCHAVLWNRERAKNKSNKTYHVNSLCCLNGKVEFPAIHEPPEPLKSLLNGEQGLISKKFLENIRAYNSMFSMTSMGAKVDNSVNDGGSVYTYKISGQNYHRIGLLLPPEGRNANFLQLYVYDTANEIQNRLNALNRRDINRDLSSEVIKQLIDMLNNHNELVKVFRSARDWYDRNTEGKLAIKLLQQRQ